MVMRFLTAVSMVTVASAAHAEAPLWKMVPAESKLTFEAIQNGAPVTGEFKKFDGEMKFSPDDLATSKVKIIVDMASVRGATDEVQRSLNDKDWFYTDVFPQAVFETGSIKLVSDKTYEADATLTIRDQTQPVKLSFTLNEYSDASAKVSGDALLMRTAFGVGQGEWKSTYTIKDEVKVHFDIKAER